MKLNICSATKTISIHVTNLNAKDAQFLGSVIRIFTDPRNARLAHELRNGRLVLQYSPEDGQIAWMDLAADHVPTPAEYINFVARFTDGEWEQLQTHTGFICALRRDLNDAETIASELLGYLPPAVKFEIVKG